MTELTHEQLRPKAAKAVQDWGTLLAKELGIDEAWRLLLTGALTVAQALYQPSEIATMLRDLADGVEAGGLKPSNKDLN